MTRHRGLVYAPHHRPRTVILHFEMKRISTRASYAEDANARVDPLLARGLGRMV